MHQLDDFRSWKSPQTLSALFIGPFDRVEQFRVLSSSEGTVAIHLAFK